MISAKIKSTETEPPNIEVKGEGLISCDTVTNISRKRRLEFILDSVHNIKVYHYVNFYELFILWLQMEKKERGSLPYLVDHTELLGVLCSPESAAWKIIG